MIKEEVKIRGKGNSGKRPSLVQGKTEIEKGQEDQRIDAIRAGSPDYPNYDVDEDGQRIVAVQHASSQQVTQSRLVVVQNWLTEFRSLD